MNPYGDIDLTSYLQIEGRRLAAELARTQSQLEQSEEKTPQDKQAPPESDVDSKHKKSAASSRHIKPAVPGQSSQHTPQKQLQQGQASSLDEVLRQMGVT